MSDQAMIAFIQALIRQPSESGHEGPVVQLVQNEMRRLGFDEVWQDTDGNAIGRIRGARRGPSILLDAHCDTVGIAPGVPWVHDPFGGVIQDGWMYGRGIADMKGALGAMVYGAARANRARLVGDVLVTASVMEENLEGAALRTVMNSVKPSYVIIGEATELNLARGGRGRAEILLETVGLPAHSSSPHLGKNAVHDMIRIIGGMERLPVHEHSFLGPTVQALTDIISAPYPGFSVIPSRCRVTYDRRLLPGETPESVLAEIRGVPEAEGIELNAQIAQGEFETWAGAHFSGPKFLPAWLLDEEAPFVQSALAGLRSANLSPKLGAYRFCTNAAYSAGTAHVPTVGFGPGQEADAHVIDERVKVADLVTAAAGYRAIIEATMV
jgi:putative selenium metabolism hydrolase